jgi:Protein of unknown function (DUF3048) N-terminal domain/Protein of unknown function (DUF3048) C-terminal domain
MRAFRSIPLVLALALGAAACSGGGESTSTTTVASTTSTTVAPTTTAPAPTTTVAPTMAPLTGLPADASLATKPVLIVKIDNHPEARPQAGLNQADIVYEEIVEGITRFAAVFHSTDAAPVGPIRSARTTDLNIFAAYGRPLIAWSGGNANVVKAVQGANVVDVGHGALGAAGGYYRDPDRRRITATEHTLFNEGTTTLFGFAGDAVAPTTYPFTFLPAGQSFAGDAATGVSLTMEGTPVEWQWNATPGQWERSEYGEEHHATDGRVTTTNVVIMFTEYGQSPADRRSPEAETVGTGELWVLSGGKVVKGTWTRPDPGTPATLTSASGQPIALTPGRSWVELAKPGTATLAGTPLP